MAKGKAKLANPGSLPKLRIPPRRAASSNNSGSATPQPPDTAVSAGSNTGTRSPEITPPPPSVQPSRAKVKKAVKELLGDHVYSNNDSDGSIEDGSSVKSVSGDEDTEDRKITKRKRGESDLSRYAASDTQEIEEDDQEDTQDALAEDLSEEEDEGDEDDEASAAQEFELPLAILVDGAMVEVTVASSITWKDLRITLADELDIRPASVKVAYRFSSDAARAAWTHLRNDDNLQGLIVRASQALNAQAGSRSKKPKKPFRVEIKPLDTGKESLKKASSAKQTSKKKKKGNVPSDDDEIEADKLKDPTKKSLPQFITDIEAANKCDDHPGHVCVVFTNNHITLQSKQVAKWALYMTKGHVSAKSPPAGLLLGDKVQKTETPASSTSVPAVQTPQNPGATPFFPSNTVYPPSPYIPYPQGYPHPFVGGLPHHAYPHPPAVPAPLNYYHDGRGASSSSTFRGDAPSSDPPEISDDLLLFPEITPWLLSLDQGPRGRDNNKFHSWASIFQEKFFSRINDIAEYITVANLLDWSAANENSMPLGTANKIIHYAKADVQEIRHQEEQRIRKNKRQSGQY
ncbi:hypothetical protein CPB83DRAFT_886752 [Crepidotus variabilis]|uniref:Uncharacterized protein n=1 Tax=Crepidotus variabilis TaxID=179855 RepID=A0A9P6JKD6_9AGAR|nr:hypothetical protein CPB83DRAFT_886752 [Crepidotus variabilis]